jgi:DNA-binding transcriptional MerR regulator
MEEKYVSLKEAAERLKVTRPSLHYYIDALQLKKHRFPLDRQRYLSLTDFERIKTLKEQAAQRNEVVNMS